MPLPIGFFMPLPLPIMIPFMMWQSAAIAAGFGTYFQYAKRRVSAMSNEEFNKADPHQLVESLYEDIVKSIPSSFAKVDSLTPVMLQSMNVMLDQAVKWLQGAITGNIFGTPNPVNDTPALDGDVIPTDTILLDPSFEVVKAFSNTKLNLIIRAQLHKYTLQAQGFIQSEFRRRNITPEQTPGTPIDTIDIKNFQFNGSKYPDIHRTTIATMNINLRAGLTQKVVLSLAALRANSLQQAKNARNATTEDYYNRKAAQYTKMILELNKLLGA